MQNLIELLIETYDMDVKDHMFDDIFHEENHIHHGHDGVIITFEGFETCVCCFGIIIRDLNSEVFEEILFDL